MLICSDIQTKDVEYVIVRLNGIYTTSEATRKYICRHQFFFSQDYQTDRDNRQHNISLISQDYLNNSKHIE